MLGAFLTHSPCSTKQQFSKVDMEFIRNLDFSHDQHEKPLNQYYEAL